MPRTSTMNFPSAVPQARPPLLTRCSFAQGCAACPRAALVNACWPRPRGSLLLAHAADIDDLLEGLDGVLENRLDRLHDTEAAFHIVDLGLHAFDGLHLAGDLDERLAVIESLEDSGGESLLDVLDGSRLGDGGVTIPTGLGGEGGAEGGLEVHEEFILVHAIVLVGSEGPSVDTVRSRLVGDSHGVVGGHHNEILRHRSGSPLRRPSEMVNQSMLRRAKIVK